MVPSPPHGLGREERITAMNCRAPVKIPHIFCQVYFLTTVSWPAFPHHYGLWAVMVAFAQKKTSLPVPQTPSLLQVLPNRLYTLPVWFLSAAIPWGLPRSTCTLHCSNVLQHLPSCHRLLQNSSSWHSFPPGLSVLILRSIAAGWTQALGRELREHEGGGCPNTGRNRSTTAHLPWASAIDTDHVPAPPPGGMWSTLGTHTPPPPCWLLPPGLRFVLLVSCVACLHVRCCGERCWTFCRRRLLGKPPRGSVVSP